MNDFEDFRGVMGKRMFRWSLILTVLITLFWTGFRLVKGYVPVTTDFLYIDIEYMLDISRWWDILLGVPLAILLAYLFTSGDVGIKGPYRISTVIGLAIGSLSLYLDSLNANDLIILIIVALSCLALSLIFSFIFHTYREIGFKKPNTIAVRAGFFASLGASIPLIFPIGVGSFLVFTELAIIFGVCFVLFVDTLPKFIPTLKKITRWITVNEE